MTEAEKDLLNRVCDVLVRVLTRDAQIMFRDSSGNVASGWDLAQILINRKQEANR